MNARDKISSGLCVLTLIGVAMNASAQDTFRVVADASKIQWVDTGPPFPNTQIAVMDGDPSKEGPFVMRFRCPNNYKIESHTHPATEAVTVLEGTFHAGTGEKYDASKLTAIRRGGFFVMPGGMAHYALCKGTTVIELRANGPWGTEMLKSQ